MSSGKRVAVGYSARDAAGSSSGQVRVYDVSLSSHSQVGSSIDGKARDDYFGLDVSMTSDGTRIAVGSNSGYVQVLEYRETPNAWIQLGADITISDSETSRFGSQVSLESDSGELIAVLTPSTSVRVFRYGDAPSPPPPPPTYSPPPTPAALTSNSGASSSLKVYASFLTAVCISLMLAY